MARTLERNAKERQAEGEAKMGKLKTNEESISDPEDMESNEIIKNAREKIENTNGSSYALFDLYEKQAWRNRVATLLISSCIHKNAYGRISTEIS